MSPAAGPSSTTNGSRNPSANLERLNAAVSAIEELQVQVRDIKEKADKKMAVLRTENEILKSNVEELSECVSFLVTMLGVRNEEDGPGLDGENGGSLSEIDPTLRGTSEPVSEASSSARKLSAMELSFAASKSKAIRDVIIDTLKIHLGTDSLAGASLPAFPFGIGEERWPKNPVDQKPYMRLNWDAAYNKWPNAEALDRIFDSLQLEDRRAAAKENLDEEFADECTAVVVTTASRDCASKNSRVSLLTKLYSKIDAIPDPNPDAAAKSRQRLRGDIILNAVPPKAKVVSTRVCQWMVKPELLDANEDWMISGRVGPNGKAWGDDEDPIDDAKGKKRKVEANVLSEEKVFKKSWNVKGKQVVLKEKLDNVLGGCDADELFNE
ncbi:hypothetical protein DFH29DRAFT_813946 [Suillus ampliporus]|nr:hypothetical protein DFH29DRAFT_813946 [Suillus ampliporus]